MEGKGLIRKPDVIGLFYDSQTGEYLCSKHPFDTVQEAIDDMDPEQERYQLIERVIVH